MRKQLSTLEIAVPNGDIYEISGGTGVPPANSVNSQTVDAGSLGVADMDNEVKEGLDELNNIVITDEDLEEIFTPGHTTQEAGSGEDEVTGDGPSLDDPDDPGTGDGPELGDIDDI